jgi:hypothetical protein
MVETAHTAAFGSRLCDIYAATMSDLECQILSSVIVKANQTTLSIHLHNAMNAVDESNPLRRGPGGTLSRSTSSGTVTTLAPGPMELGAIIQTNISTQCGGRGHWSYFCTTPKDWKEGDPIKKSDFDKTK